MFTCIAQAFQSHVIYAARCFSVVLLLRFDLDLAPESVAPISSRSALLTASSLGKTLATCGSSTMTLVDFLILLAYLPRTISPKSDRLYSGRDQSLSSDLAFFIDFSLLLCSGSRTNDSNQLASLSV